MRCPPIQHPIAYNHNATHTTNTTQPGTAVAASLFHSNAHRRQLQAVQETAPLNQVQQREKPSDLLAGHHSASWLCTNTTTGCVLKCSKAAALQHVLTNALRLLLLTCCYLTLIHCEPRSNRAQAMPK